MIQHEIVTLRGGPLDGADVVFGPTELGVELRISTIDRESDPPRIFEHFYAVVGVVRDQSCALVADHVSTTGFNILTIDDEAAR